MAGLVAAFIFAVQMVNFPILPGVSGHLLGGALAAILVGPYVGILCVSVVLVVQALLFADGGLTALGTNITNMALIGVTVGYLVARALAPLLLPRRESGLTVLAFLAALIGTLCAATGFVLEYVIGGASGASLGAVTGYLLITHTLIGIGEGVITAITVTAVAAARPDLVYLLRNRSRSAATAPRRPRVSANQFLIGFALVAIAVAGLLSYLASNAPDGLDATTQRGCTVSEVDGFEQLDGTCIAQHADEHHLAGSPLADYTIDGNDALTGVAGVLGVAAAFAVLVALVRVIGVRRRPAETGGGPARDLAGRTP
jgi:cobalt/nickel transport system permease protein